MGKFAEIQERARQAKIAEKAAIKVYYKSYFEISPDWQASYQNNYYFTKESIWGERFPYFMKKRFSDLYSASINVFSTDINGNIYQIKKNGKQIIGTVPKDINEITEILINESIEFSRRSFATGKPKRNV